MTSLYVILPQKNLKRDLRVIVLFYIKSQQTGFPRDLATLRK